MKLSKNKKYISIIVTLLIAITITSCSKEPVKNEKVSDRMAIYAQSAVETATDYLEHNIDAETAIEKIEHIELMTNTIIGSNSEAEEDHLITNDILLLELAISRHDRGEATNEDVEKAQNEIIDLLYE